MKKSLYIVLFFLFAFLFILSPKALAFTCDFTIDPTSITDQMTTIRTLTIDGRDNFSSSNKYVWLDDYPQGGRGSSGFTPSDGEITIPNAYEQNNKFKSPSIEVTVRDSNNIFDSPLCTFVIPVVYACTVGISPTTLTPTTEITYTAKNISDASHKVIVHRKSDGAEMDFGEDCYDDSLLSTTGINLKSFSSGIYSIETYSGCSNPPGDIICPIINFNTDPNAGGIITGTIEPGKAKSPPLPPCAPGALNSITCPLINSAIGPIPTDIKGFIKIFFSVVLTISGAIAVILIIISGYKLIASQGNPEKVQEAKEQLTAAIVGLMFVIFSLVILETIGVDILGLPGFGSQVTLQ